LSSIQTALASSATSAAPSLPTSGCTVRKRHSIDPGTYWERYGLNRETGLVSPSLFRKLSARNDAHLARVRPE
jgi:hypothetical protein